MLKDATYKEKCSLLKNWLPFIFGTIKSDIKKDHLLQDWMFAKKYFNGKNINKLTPEELTEGYTKALDEEERAEDIAEFICQRWLVKNTDLYDFYEEKLKKISPDFTELTEIQPVQSQELIKDSIAKFGSEKTYLFSVMNSVVFSKDTYNELQKRAANDAQQQKAHAQQESERKQEILTQQGYQTEIARLTDRFEKKFSGLEKKYLKDTDALKKQIAILQRKINER